MHIEAKMAKLSPTMEVGVLASWLVQIGDKIADGQAIAEVSTDKATVELQVPEGGYLRKIFLQEGEEGAVGDVIALMTETLAEPVDDYKLPVKEVPTKEPIPPENDESQTQSEAPKTPSAASSMAEPQFVPMPPLEAAPQRLDARDGNGHLRSSPLARKLAKEKGVDISMLPSGSGPDGRITARDIEKASPSKFQLRSSLFPKKPPGSYEQISLTPMRKVVGRRLQEAKTFIPHIYLEQEIQVDALIDLREQLKRSHIKVSFNDLITRACALTLKEFPGVNSGYNSVDDEIILFQTIDISIAVSVEGGLITPIVRYADCKNVHEISVEVKELAGRARQGKLKPEEFQGGSFTISNLGMFGTTNFKAVINPPQACILAVGGFVDKVIFKQGAFLPSKVLNVTLSADHRVVDGADGAKFLKRLKEILETPLLLVI